MMRSFSFGKLKKAKLSVSSPTEKESHVLETVSDGKLVEGTVHDYYRDMTWLADAMNIREVDRDFLIHQRLLETARVLPEIDFMLMMLRIAPFYSFSRIDKFRSAVAHFQLRLKEERGLQWSQTKSFRRDFAGLTGLCERPGVRGAILDMHLEQLINFTMALGQCDYAWGFIVGHAALIRHSELMRLTADCVAFPPLGATVLRIVGGKGQHHEGADEDHGLPDGEDFVRAEGRDDVRETLELLVSLANGKEGLLFPKWNRKVANDIIRQCAEARGWTKKVQWSFHCLRHGKCAQMKLDGVDLAERMLRGRWKTRAVCEDYSKINAE